MDRSLARALGPLWLLGFRGESPPDDFLRLLDRYRPRAVILFRDNLPAGAASLASLRRRLEEATECSLCVFLDEEGGWIQQLGEGPWPSPRAQALAGVEAVEACHRAMAARAAAAGAQVLCAPLADLDDGALNPVIGTRSFGSDPAEASACVAAALRGLLAGGVLPVLKHYPGHGDSREDSHLTLPAVPGDRSRALIPFRAGLEAGAPALMSAHLLLQGDADTRPATFRPDLMRERLSSELGFGGLVISDALEMAGAAVIPLEERAALALDAGCHLLTLARWEPGAERLLDSLAGAVSRKSIGQNRLDEAGERWRRFRDALPGEGAPPGSSPELEALRRAALFVPGTERELSEAELASAWDGRELDIEFGPCGSWREEEFLAALRGLPLRRLGPADTLRAGSYLYVGRTPPREQRLTELAALRGRGRAPRLLICGPWAWSLPFSPRLATAESTPPGLCAFLSVLSDAHPR